MRRKSSAQNLLSSFKSSSGSATSNGNSNGTASGGGNSNVLVAVPPPTAIPVASASATSSSTNGAHMHTPPGAASSSLPIQIPPPPLAPSSNPSSAVQTPSTSGTSTPFHPPFTIHQRAQSPPLVPPPHLPPQQQQQQQQSGAISSTTTTPAMGATPTAREWDSQSLHADSTTAAAAAAAVGATLSGPFLPPVGNGGVVGGGVGGSGGSPGATIEYLRDLVQKRIITLTYTRNVHDGRTHWFHTIMMTRAELDRAFNNTAMKKRTHRFAILAMSLSSLFDITHPSDFLRSALNMLTEYEQAKEDNERPKIRLWKWLPKRQTGMGDFSLGMPDSSDTYLTMPHMPFPLDYTQTLLSLLDILSAFYAKLAKLLGPSPFPHASQHMLGLSPHPGVSYLFQNQTHITPADEALWNVALGSTALGGTAGGGGLLNSPPPSWTPAQGELVLKVDSKFKKIISTLLKDLDVFARNSIRDELASLDPLLRNVGGGGLVGTGDEGGRATDDYDQ
ncbi:hypothetical protein F5888DRAFT_1702774 [Russula emetica]|nr:hypothetical protein F5888DRAFT_1702774 [Russula emetica]